MSVDGAGRDRPLRVHGRWTVATDDPHWSVPPVVLRWTDDEWSVPSCGSPSDVVLLGWTAEELQVIPVGDLVHPDDHEVLDDLASHEAEARFAAVDVRVLGRDSRYWWTQWSRRPSAAPGCDLHGVTYLGPAEWGCPVGTWRWHVEREAVTWSVELLDMFGVKIGPPAGMASFLETVHEEDRASAATTLRDAVADRGDFAYLFRCPTSTGHERWFYASGRCQADGDGGRVVVGLVKYLNPPPAADRVGAIGCG